MRRRCLLVNALKAEGCHADRPRYPLLHQQPFFTEGTCREVLRLPPEVRPPVYRADALPRTEATNCTLVKLPAFPQAASELLDQYALAFRKVIASASQIAEKEAGRTESARPAL
jgi:perosamine synthetase